VVYPTGRVLQKGIATPLHERFHNVRPGIRFPTELCRPERAVYRRPRVQGKWLRYSRATPSRFAKMSLAGERMPIVLNGVADVTKNRGDPHDPEAASQLGGVKLTRWRGCSLSTHCLSWRSDVALAECRRSSALEFSQRYPFCSRRNTALPVASSYSSGHGELSISVRRSQGSLAGIFLIYLSGDHSRPRGLGTGGSLLGVSFHILFCYRSSLLFGVLPITQRPAAAAVAFPPLSRLPTRTRFSGDFGGSGPEGSGLIPNGTN
jgi:hypothetical protein